jgi:hypothetical protein
MKKIIAAVSLVILALILALAYIIYILRNDPCFGSLTTSSILATHIKSGQEMTLIKIKSGHHEKSFLLILVETPYLLEECTGVVEGKILADEGYFPEKTPSEIIITRDNKIKLEIRENNNITPKVVWE